MLPTIELVRHRRRLPHLVGMKTPQRFSVHRIDGHEHSAILAKKQKSCSRSECATPGVSSADLGKLPNDFSRLNIDRTQNFLRYLTGYGPQRSTQVVLARFPFSGALRIDTAFF